MLVYVYVPYADKFPFWEGVSALGILPSSSIILGGDLNFNLLVKEVLGAHPRRDPLEFVFSHWIERNHLVDLKPPKLSQTGRRKVEKVFFGHKKDRFLLS
jgi:hypothetical protein